MAGARVRRRFGAQHLEVRDAELAKRAGSALLAADERIRVTHDELGFAEAELGSRATATASEILVAARTLLIDGFRLNRLNHEAMPGTADEVRARYLLIVQLCEQIDDVLDEQASALADKVARSRRAPEIITGVRADVAHLRARIPDARETIDLLAARSAEEALTDVEANPAEAEQLLAFAEHCVGVAERRREAGQREQANLALEVSLESVRRAATLLDAVQTFELQVALVGLPPVGVNTDPLAHLNRLRTAHAELVAATTSARERATAPTPPLNLLHRAVEDADRKLDVARDAIAGHPGWIGAEALTRLAESERIRIDLGHCLGGSAGAVIVIHEVHRMQAMTMARSVASLAGEALLLARHDIDASRRQDRGRWAARFG
ncbi:hypothetical protein [Agromyces subbeticus]|uniref:hypothetical protein n=1 Tax=Agromyces subbeticus TaxID=293890 RepID=UPI0003B73055|nr:hypothetical protein [Agromyces subbeticus]